MEPLAAGSFSRWVVEMQGALRGEREADVPCAGCTACCTSSHFIHIAPDETEVLAHIPAALLFPAPQRPAGHVLLGHDERGHCPMLIDSGCSIYEHRPRTCRTYDCRAFAATGVVLEDERLALVAARVARWEFDMGTEADRRQRAAVLAAVEFLREELGPLYEVAALAIEVHELFLDVDTVDHDAVRAAVQALRTAGEAAEQPSS